MVVPLPQLDHVHSINGWRDLHDQHRQFRRRDDDMDEPINLGGNGAQLIVNGPAQWIMNDTLTANTRRASARPPSAARREWSWPEYWT